MKKSTKWIFLIIGLVIGFFLGGLVFSESESESGYSDSVVSAEDRESDEYYDPSETVDKYDYISETGDRGFFDDFWDDSEDDYENYYEEYKVTTADYPLGTCEDIRKRTVIISIFTDDYSTQWTDRDAALVDRSLKNMNIATKWLTDNAAKYNARPEFVYDWTKNEDLYITCSLDADIVGEGYDTVESMYNYIDDNIDLSYYKEKYLADNVLFCFYINSPGESTLTSATWTYDAEYDLAYEFIIFYMNCDYEEETPAGFAHEILHAFGAPDLYKSDDDGFNFGITQEYVDYCERSRSNDIMYTTYDNKTYASYYNKITNVLSEMDAYYVGLTDYSAEVEKWGFDASEHVGRQYQ